MGVSTQPQARRGWWAGRLATGPVSAQTRDDHGLARPGGTRPPRFHAPEVGLYGRVLAVNASILVVAVLLLVLTPVSVSPSVTRGQLAVLLAGLALMLASNAVLLRLSMAPLDRLMALMRSADVLQPGRRLDAGGTPEVADVISAFNATLERLEEERRSSMRRVLFAQEAERRRIAQELHDQIGQNLTAVLLDVERLGEQLNGGPADTLRDMEELVKEILDEVRRISYELRPPVLDDLGLVVAIESLCDGIARRSGLEVSRSVDDPPPGLDADAELAIDGVGVAGAKPGGGVRGMRERAVTIHGTLDVVTSPHGGADVALRVPTADV